MRTSRTPIPIVDMVKPDVNDDDNNNNGNKGTVLRGER